MAFSLTEEQQAAVDNRGGGLLVSAAAGSGKTRVLVERLLARVEEGADVDRFLVITYTKAAAAELRGRIVEEISDRLALRPTDGHLRRQATLVYKAGISTIHAFCAQLLRECGHLLDLDPDFRLCDEGEAGILMLRALNDVLDKRYEAMDSDFAQLVDTMSAGRDDARLVQIVLDIRGRVQAHPNPAAWLAQQERAFALEGVTDPVQTPWGELLLTDAAGQASYWRRRMEEARDLCERDANLLANYGDSVAQTAQALQQFEEAAAQGWDAARNLLPIPFPTVGRKKMVDDPAAVERVKAIRTACKKRLEKLEDWFADSGEDLLADLRTVYPAMRGLFALVRDFEEAYAAEKARRGLVDFSDLEHMAVRLLVGEDGQPSELARQWSTRYDEIMVDEYQDTNEVQNAIFSALSRDGTNLFMVGDVKQSIYRFRLADPTIFLGKYRSFKPYSEAREGEERRVILSRNFRSRPEVLEGCNDLFRAVMSVPFGEMEYADDQALYPGASYEPDPAYCVELDALDGDIDGEEGAEKVSRDLLEARFAARRIRELLDEGFPVSDGEGGTRPVRPSDMVILLRSPNTVLRHYARALAERDILWEAEGGGDFFGSTEISVALSLLQIVDNPRQDVPLISVLRSPVYGFSADRLAEIRAASPDTDFYAALEADDGEDSRAFLAELDDLRFGSGDMSSHQLLWHIYDRTNLLGIFGAMEEGEARQGNLLALAELARQFEGSGHKGLFRFLTYLTRLRENGNTLTPPTPGRTGGGVRIMSIHKSKGLEFPVVLLCGLARRLNREDMSRPILFHPKLGVGPKGLDVERGIEYPTLARMAVARQLEREMMAEELRLLYVAMTRAKEKLILSVALTGGGKDMEKLAGDSGYPVDPQVLLACQSVGQWVLLHALCRPEAGALRRAAGQEVAIPEAPLGPQWDIRFVDGTALTQAPPRRWMAPEREIEENEDWTDLTGLLRWTYPHGAEVAIPSKLTATQLKGRALDEEAAEEAPRPSRPLSFGRPRFAAEELGLTAAQRGTALHQVLQYIDFERSETVEGVRAEISRLVEQQYITPQQGEAVDPAPIAAFFQSDLGQDLLSSVSLRREFKFSILEPAHRYYPQAGEGEQVLFQGVVDCYYETLEGITVVDFKTDRVTKATLAHRAEHYRPQLEAYSRALEEITGKRVIRRVLWFFALGRSVDL
ncbi:helicase-exonuclease AddAB subunit AddA [uncultured Flavonifractor sp.]|uniref:DNA 3'-5' helicase n=1 Tax=Candidatus Flavonifractor intestinigallinarum TaxID=2838586 RepID=A0A9D2MMC6_9FIRM|nr:helicase-exonuclease AddAB subunit AddA [uncultured Flavonifractor sp.]HJB80356.1 helicase-exonuclease AddAB subunit AddA [Candidatus Flavonifractor intestinigallinarum]